MMISGHHAKILGVNNDFASTTQIKGKLFDVLSQLFTKLAKVKKIIVPGDFISHRGLKSIHCSVKAAEGLIYPLRSSLIFIHKPVIYLRHSEIKCVEFLRIGQHTASARSFDLVLTRLADDNRIIFQSIEIQEMELLIRYFKQAEVKVHFEDGAGTKREITCSSIEGAGITQ